MSRPQVVCLPGGVAPAALRCALLKAGVGDDADLFLKDLEVYRGPAPPPDFSIDLELKGVDRFADDHGLDRFHLVGYSGGGFISLAYAGTRPGRVESLALFEPASIPGPLSADEGSAYTALVETLHGLEGPAFMDAFVRAQLKPGVEPPPRPPGPPSPEMQKRPAGIEALMRAFSSYQFDRSTLEACHFPVFIGYGDQTNEIEAVRAGILARLFEDIRVRRFSGVHHFVAPELIYTKEHVRLLRELWRRGTD